MNFFKKSLLTLAFLVFNLSNAQDDLLKELDSSSKDKGMVTSAFKGLQICNMQSTKMVAKNEWYFLVSHRFGDLTNGADNFFGLDNALTKIGGLYGINDWLTVGAARHTYGKTYELSAKYRLVNQSNDFGVTIVGYNTMDINTELKKDLYPNLKGSDRLAFSSQLLISRKFSENFSAELNPIYIHKNLYEPAYEKKDAFLVALGGRYKITKRMSINGEYAALLNKVSGTPYQNPLTLGLDIDTGGHIFQMLFSTSQAMNDVSYFTQGTGITGGKGIFFGFNIYRVF